LYAQITGADGNVRLQYNRIGIGGAASWTSNRQDDDNNSAVTAAGKTTGTAIATLGTGHTRPRNVALLACIKF
jgi:hypothetical protein